MLNIKIRKHTVEEVKIFNYLGSKITVDGQNQEECRVAQAQEVLFKKFVGIKYLLGFKEIVETV